MCPCPICAAIALILIPFGGWKWAKRKLKKHHCSCDRCQEAEHNEHQNKQEKCTCVQCQKKGKK